MFESEKSGVEQRLTGLVVGVEFGSNLMRGWWLQIPRDCRVSSVGLHPDQGFLAASDTVKVSKVFVGRPWY